MTTFLADLARALSWRVGATRTERWLPIASALIVAWHLAAPRLEAFLPGAGGLVLVDQEIATLLAVVEGVYLSWHMQP